MREDQEYAGGRVRLTAMTAGARLSLQVDIGFGDAVRLRPRKSLTRQEIAEIKARLARGLDAGDRVAIERTLKAYAELDPKI